MKLLSDTTISATLKTVEERIIAEGPDVPKLNQAYLSRIEQTIKMLNSKNIRVFLILEPRDRENEFKNTFPVFMKAKGCIGINLADPKFNPEFYTLDYAFDAGHLSRKGDSLYTVKIAAMFNKVVR